MTYLFPDIKQVNISANQICEGKNECKAWQTQARAVYKVKSVLTLFHHKICFLFSHTAKCVGIIYVCKYLIAMLFNLKEKQRWQRPRLTLQPDL